MLTASGKRRGVGSFQISLGNKKIFEGFHVLIPRSIKLVEPKSSTPFSNVHSRRDLKAWRRTNWISYFIEFSFTCTTFLRQGRPAKKARTAVRCV